MSSLWLDVDLLDGLPTKKVRAPNEAVARSIFFPEFPPSMIVGSGGGLQPYWILKEPLILDSEQAIQEAADLAWRWNRALQIQASIKGFVLDSVGDLPRVLRVPGSTNTKIEGQPRPVRLIELNDRRYNMSEFREFLDSIDMRRDKAPAAATAPQAVGRLVYDAAVVIDPVRFKLLYEADLQFRLSWDHQRGARDFPDQSLSAYDQALANFAAQAGWSDQEICNLLIAHRRNYKDAKLKTKLRDSYFVPTIRNAREVAGAEPTPMSREIVPYQAHGVPEVIFTTSEAQSPAELPKPRGLEPELFTMWKDSTNPDHAETAKAMRRTIWEITEFDSYLARHRPDDHKAWLQAYDRLSRPALEFWMTLQFAYIRQQFREQGREAPIMQLVGYPDTDLLSGWIEEAVDWMSSTRPEEDAHAYLLTLLEKAKVRQERTDSRGYLLAWYDYPWPLCGLQVGLCNCRERIEDWAARRSQSPQQGPQRGGPATWHRLSTHGHQ
jgi:hypothetical protein